MKIRVVYRIGGLERCILINGFKMPSVYKTETKVFNCNTVEDLFSMFPPTKPSDNLKKAAKEFLEGNRYKLIYNFGKGNSIFTLYESKMFIR